MRFRRFRRVGIVMAILALALVAMPAMAAAEMEGGAYYGMVQETSIDDLRVPLKYAQAAKEYQGLLVEEFNNPLVRLPSLVETPDFIWEEIGDLLRATDCTAECGSRYCCLNVSGNVAVLDPTVAFECKWGCCPAYVIGDPHMEAIARRAPTDAGVLWIFCCVW